MYQEISKKNLSYLRITVFLVGVFIILNMINYLAIYLKIDSMLIDLLLLGCIPLTVFYIKKRWMIGYRYKSIGEEFIIKEVLGKKENIIVHMNFSQIIKIESVKSGHYKEDRKKEYGSKKKLYHGISNASCFYCIYVEDGKENYFEFEPSQKMINILHGHLKC